MLRTTWFALAITVGGLLFADRARADFSIVSDSSTILTPGQAFDFNFEGRTNAIKPFHNLKGIRVDYTFHLPTLPGTKSLDMLADLMIPDVVLGADYKVGFDVTVNLADKNPTYYADRFTSSANGFIFSNTVKSQLLDDNHLTGELSAGGGYLDLLNQYFNLPPTPGGVAGSISAFMTLTFDGSRGQVPEPASMLVWGLLGAGLLVHRRWRAKTAG